jgi:hypothetical protein
MLLTDNDPGGRMLNEGVYLGQRTPPRIANEAKVKQLALTHFDAKRYETMQHTQEAENKAKKTSENSCMTTDGMILDL